MFFSVSRCEVQESGWRGSVGGAPSLLLEVVTENGKRLRKPIRNQYESVSANFLLKLILRSPKVKFSEMPYFSGNVPLSQSIMGRRSRRKYSRDLELFFRSSQN